MGHGGIKEYDIKKNTIRANRADLETTNASIMSEKNTVHCLNYAAHRSAIGFKDFTDYSQITGQCAVIDFYI